MAATLCSQIAKWRSVDCHSLDERRFCHSFCSASAAAASCETSSSSSSSPLPEEFHIERISTPDRATKLLKDSAWKRDSISRTQRNFEAGLKPFPPMPGCHPEEKERRGQKRTFETSPPSTELETRKKYAVSHTVRKSLAFSASTQGPILFYRVGQTETRELSLHSQTEPFS